MATVHREEGFNFRIYPNDHHPAHVHVFKAGGEVIVKLPTETEAAVIRSYRRMSVGDVFAAARLVEANAKKLWKAWRKYHG